MLFYPILKCGVIFPERSTESSIQRLVIGYPRVYGNCEFFKKIKYFHDCTAFRAVILYQLLNMFCNMCFAGFYDLSENCFDLIKIRIVPASNLVNASGDILFCSGDLLF